MKSIGNRTIAIVAPCCNEQEMIVAFLDRIHAVAAGMPAYSFEFFLVNDGSMDDTPALLNAAADADTRIKVLHLARNFGHQRAIAAGLDACDGDMVVVIDSDLQDPPELISELVAALEAGADVAHAVRRDRSSDSLAKRFTAKLFYQLMRRFVLPELPEDSGDFKAFTRPVLEALRTYRERMRFMRGMIATLGFRQVEVPYTRAPRAAGKTKFSPWHVLRFARDAIVSNTVLPLRIGVFSGGMALLAALGYAVTLVWEWGRGPIEHPLEHFMLMLLLGMGGLSLLLLGLIGEYLRCIIIEIKQRPLYIVASTRNLAEKPEEAPLKHA